jgi:Icc protein
MINRRKFISVTARSIVLLSAGKLLTAAALPQKEDIALRFAIASDGHYGEDKTDYVNNFNNIVGSINLDKTKRGVDFAFINGDIIHNNPAFLAPAKAALDKLSMQYYVSRGNHDMIPEPVWQETWGKGSNYTFEVGDSGFIVLSTTDETGKYICPDLEWTHKHLTMYSDKKQLFVFMHITPVKWTDNANACPQIVEMFNRQKNLKAIFNGHDHDQDYIKESEGKPYFFDSHLGGSWGTDYKGYRIVEVLKNGSVVTYQVNPAAGTPVNSKKLV